jgi:peptidoglycan hydrolase CwlO-like protein
MPNDVHRGLMRRGPNADYRVHILMQRIEQSLSEALEAAAVRDDISEFKNKAMAALSNSEETIERNFALHPKRGILSEKINQLKEQITSAQTILDPKAFFSTIYAIMRTTR